MYVCQCLKFKKNRWPKEILFSSSTNIFVFNQRHFPQDMLKKDFLRGFTVPSIVDK